MSDLLAVFLDAKKEILGSMERIEKKVNDNSKDIAALEVRIIKPKSGLIGLAQNPLIILAVLSLALIIILGDTKGSSTVGKITERVLGSGNTHEGK